MYCLLVVGDPNKLYSKVKKKGIKTKSTGTRFTRSELESESESTGTQIDKVITLYTDTLYNSKILYNVCRPGRVVQSVMYLATDVSLSADPGVASSIPVRSYTFAEIDHEIISTVIFLPSAESFKKGCYQLRAKVARSTGLLLVQACLGKSVVR